MVGTWANLSHNPGATVDTMLLLTDGTVIAHEENSSNWRRLTPDPNGDYRKGTWSSLPPMPPNPAIPASQGGPDYGPKFFGSAVLADGTVFVIGGEYNVGRSPGDDVAAATRFDPVLGQWTNVATPAGWTRVGDPPMCVLADGRVLVGHLDSSSTAFFDPASSAFTAGPNKGDRCAEESFTLLPDGTVLAVDCSSIPSAEKFVPELNRWVSAGSTPTALPQACAGIIAEIGPTVLLPNGHALVIGATGDTALYAPPANPSDPGTWVQGPTIVDGANNTMHPIDAPAALLPNGRVLFAASPSPPCSFPGPTSFFEFDPATNTLTAAPSPSNSGSACFTGRMLLLPNGQVLFSNQSSKVTIYTPDGTFDPAWRPVITSIPKHLAVGHHYLLEGRQLNGLSEACTYGDDATMATNYPIARLEQGPNTFYCRTSHHSTMAVATGNQIVSTIVAIPSTVPPGSYGLVVVANGIPSEPTSVEITSALPQLEVNLEDAGHFAVVCDTAYRSMELFNVGDADLIVDRVEIVPAGNFAMAAPPTAPFTLEPGEDVEFTIAYTSTTPGLAEKAVVRIMSNDPNRPTLDLPVDATAGSGSLVTIVGDGGDFGEVCVGSFRDAPVTLANSGTCDLTITAVSSSSSAFKVPSVVNFPLVIEAAGAIAVPVRFAPQAQGVAAATLAILSDDPAGAANIVVSGVAPSPRLTVIVAGNGEVGHTCVGEFTDASMEISNGGHCSLTITNITSSSPEFVVPTVLDLPLVIAPGTATVAPVRFQPTSFGSKTATVTLVSDDPTSPRQVVFSGLVPAGKLAVTGSTYFGEVDCGFAEKTVSICNVGECPLHVTSVAFHRKRRHFKLVNNPFPATLQPGSCLGVVIRYTASCDPECCELVITSDDPTQPTRTLDVVAFTRCEPKCRRHHDDCCEDDDKIEDEDERC